MKRIKRMRLAGLVVAAALSCAARGIAAVTVVETFPKTGFVETVAAVRQLPDEQVRQGLTVRLRGIVLYVHSTAFYLDDGTDAIYVQVAEGPVPVRVRDVVELSGKTCEGAFAADIILLHAEVLGQGTLPAPKVVSFADLDSGMVDCRLVQVEGVVRAQRRYSSRLGGTLLLSVERFPIEVGIQLREDDALDFGVGAKVRVVGVACGRRNEAKQLVSARVATFLEDIHVIASPPLDPFDRPLKSTANLFRYGHKTDPEVMVKIEGAVVHHVRGEWLFVKDETGSLRISTQDAVRMNPGTRVEVVGFAGRMGSVSVLEDALVRPVGVAETVLACPLSVREIFTNHLDAELVTVDATLCGSTAGSGDWSLLCQQGETFFRARWKRDSEVRQTPDGRSASEQAWAGVPWEVGSRLRLTGVVLLEGEVASGALSLPEGLSLVIRSPQEIELLAAPPWWDVRKLAILSGLLALVVGAVVLWVRELRREVRRRGEALAEGLTREARLEERQRIGRELHDTFAQGLTGLGYELMAMARALPETSRVKQHLDRASDLLRRTREESRRGILNIRAVEVAAKDLPIFLADSLALLLQDAPLELDFKSTGTPQTLSAQIQSNLMRIAQEAAANTLQHAQANLLQVKLAFEAEGVRLTIADNGIGFQPAKAEEGRQGRFGLCSMRERAEQIGATYQLESEPGKGTRVSLWIPAGSDEQERPPGLDRDSLRRSNRSPEPSRTTLTS